MDKKRRKEVEPFITEYAGCIIRSNNCLRIAMENLVSYIKFGDLCYKKMFKEYWNKANSISQDGIITQEEANILKEILDDALDNKDPNEQIILYKGCSIIAKEDHIYLYEYYNDDYTECSNIDAAKSLVDLHLKILNKEMDYEVQGI